MACPRCDSPLERYALVDAEAVVCEECGYIGVPVEHRRDPVEVESWAEALARFEGGDSGDTASEAEPAVSGPDEAAETVPCPVCGDRFDSPHAMATHRGLVHEE